MRGTIWKIQLVSIPLVTRPNTTIRTTTSNYDDNPVSEKEQNSAQNRTVYVFVLSFASCQANIRFVFCSIYFCVRKKTETETRTTDVFFIIIINMNKFENEKIAFGILCCVYDFRFGDIIIRIRGNWDVGEPFFHYVCIILFGKTRFVLLNSNTSPRNCYDYRRR